MNKSTARETGRYKVAVEQHGEVDTEYFDTFAALCGQFVNYGLCECHVESYEDTLGEFTEDEHYKLRVSFAEGANHWSHKV